MKNKDKDIEGIENHEHFIDIFKEIDILKDNLTENTDTAFEILKMCVEAGVCIPQMK